jgi:hypothetical protein
MNYAAVANSIAKPLTARLAIAGVATLVSAGAFSAALAAPVIPNMIGTLTVEGKGAYSAKSKHRDARRIIMVISAI